MKVIDNIVACLKRFAKTVGKLFSDLYNYLNEDYEAPAASSTSSRVAEVEEWIKPTKVVKIKDTRKNWMKSRFYE